MYIALLLIASLLSGYLMGSVSWAVIIAKVFYHIDIYKVGSGNAGGTNVGRACGKKAAYITIVLDVLKCMIPVWAWFFLLSYSGLNNYILSVSSSFPLSTIYYTAGLGAGIGHIFPIYYHFKGGKAVSCYGGFVIATNWFLAAAGLSIFLLVFAWKKRVSLSSLVGVTFVSICASIAAFFVPQLNWMLMFPFGMKMDGSYVYAIYIVVYSVFVVVMHHANIARLAEKTEPETHFKKD